MSSVLPKDPQMRQLVREFVARGYVCVRLNGGHFQIRDGARPVATFSGTKTTWRDYKNVEAAVKRYEREKAK